MGIARQTGRSAAETLKRFAWENRMIGEFILSVLKFENARKGRKSRKDGHLEREAR